MIASIERSPQRYARIAGVLYLAIILLGMFGELVVRGTLFVSGDATATANAISASPLLWRAGIVGDLMMQVLDVPVIVIFYFLLRPVSRSLALFATLINLVQTAVLVANKLNLVVPLLLLGNASYLKVFAPEQLHALSYLAIQAHGFGFGIGLLFFGFACLVQGYLMFKSGYFPNALGWLLAMAGLSYLVNSCALLLARFDCALALRREAKCGARDFRAAGIRSGSHLPESRWLRRSATSYAQRHLLPMKAGFRKGSPDRRPPNALCRDDRRDAANCAGDRPPLASQTAPHPFPRRTSPAGSSRFPPWSLTPGTPLDIRLSRFLPLRFRASRFHCAPAFAEKVPRSIPLRWTWPLCVVSPATIVPVRRRRGAPAYGE